LKTGFRHLKLKMLPFKEKLSTSESSGVIEAKTIILKGQSGSVYITAEDPTGARIQISSADQSGHVILGMLDLNLEKAKASPCLNMMFHDTNTYWINLWANSDTPGLAYYSQVPPSQHSESLMRLTPDKLALRDNLLTSDDLVKLLSLVSPSEQPDVNTRQE